MKKEKSLNFLSSKWLMVTCFVLGMMFLGNVNVKAQSPLANEIQTMENLRNTFIPGTAKYDLTQAAVQYLQALSTNLVANPNYFADVNDQFDGGTPFNSDIIRRVSPRILANYTDAELADFAGTLGNGEASVPVEQEIQWILDANAY
jgi:hypothetical protein